MLVADLSLQVLLHVFRRHVHLEGRVGDVVRPEDLRHRAHHSKMNRNLKRFRLLRLNCILQVTCLAPTNLFVAVAVVDEGGALPTEVFHEISCEAGDALETQRSSPGQHVELIAAFGFLLLEVVAEAARRDDIQPVVVKVFGDSTDGSCETNRFKGRSLEGVWATYRHSTRKTVR